MDEKYRVLIVISKSEVLGSIRIVEPYSKIEVEDIEFVVEENLKKVWNNKGEIVVDCVMFQRPVDSMVVKFMKEFKGKITTVVETDDDLRNVPYSSPAYIMMYSGENKAKIYEDCLKKCDYIHTSTPELATREKATVFLNAVDLGKYKDWEEVKRQFRELHHIPDDVKIINFSGSTTHHDSLLLIKDTITELLKDNNLRVAITSNIDFIKTIFPDEHKNLILTGWLPYSEAHKINSIGDITLCPLPQNVFNERKSELKCIESGAWGVPTICSNIAPYIRFNELSNGGSILIKKETTENWIKAIYELLENEYLYDTLANKSYNAVKEHYDINIINKKRLAFWEKLKAEKKERQIA